MKNGNLLVTTQISHSLRRLACYKSFKFGRLGTFARSACVAKASLPCTLTPRQRRGHGWPERV